MTRVSYATNMKYFLITLISIILLSNVVFFHSIPHNDSQQGLGPIDLTSSDDKFRKSATTDLDNISEKNVSTKLTETFNQKRILSREQDTLGIMRHLSYPSDVSTNLSLVGPSFREEGAALIQREEGTARDR
ncbi:MAG: hypothetical protein ACFFD4_26390 [Candidatus Odinarchaeota archaeon]